MIMTQVNFSNELGFEKKASDESARLFDEWKSQKKETEPKKLFDEAYDYCERLGLEKEKKLIFLQDVWCDSFRERLRDMSDDDLTKGTNAVEPKLPEESVVVEEYARLFGELCDDKQLQFSANDKSNFKRRLEIERLVQIGGRCSDVLKILVEPKENRGISSLGNVKNTKTSILTQFDVLNQVSNVRMTSVNALSNGKQDVSHPTIDLGQQHSGQKDVFFGTQVETRQKVAVKTSRGGNSDAAMVREAEIQASIAHQGVPTIISLNKSGLPVIVESFIEGQSWDSILNPKKNLASDEKTKTEEMSTSKKWSLEDHMDVLIQVGKIMTHVHRNSRFAHGDIKPDNVMIGEYGEVYVIDWGYAIDLDGDEEERVIQGCTEAYCPPEVRPLEGWYDESKPATSAADVYMLGGILHQIVVPTRKTFNQTLLEFTNYEVSQWKNYGEFPEVSGVSQEMREVLQKALAYEPENRYQDAGEFVDALKKYQKTRRFNENKERFTQLRKQAEDARFSHKREETAIFTNELIGCVNEFSLIHKEIEDDKEKPKNEDEFFVDVLKEELQARSFLLDCAIDAQDYGQADALAKTQDVVLETYKIDDQTSDWRGQIRTELQAQRKRIARGYLGRKINKSLIFVIVLVGIFALLTLGFALHKENQRAQAVNDALDKEKKAAKANERAAIEARKRTDVEIKARKEANQQLFEIYKRNALKAREEKFGQGEMMFWAKALELIDPTTNKPAYPQCYNWLDIASKTSILPQKVSSFNPIVKASGFSADGRFFMCQDIKNNFDVWDAETLQTVSSVNLSFPDKTTTYIFANPCFEDENNIDPILASRFIVFNTGGDVWLISNQEGKVKLITYFFNVRNVANDVKEEFGKFNPNTPLIMDSKEFNKNLAVSFDELIFTTCSVTEKDSEGLAFLIVGSKTGDVLTYSLPDFRLVGTFKTQCNILGLASSIQRKYVLIFDEDHSTCLRYSFDGKLLNKYDFGFPSKTNLFNTEYLRGYVLSPSGKKLIVASDQGAICVVDVDSNKVIAKTSNAQKEGTFIGRALARLYWIDEEHFLSLGYNNDCLVWNLSEMESDGVPRYDSIDCGLPLSWSGIQTAAFSSKTQKLVLAGQDHKLRLIDVGEEKLVAQTMGMAPANIIDWGFSNFGYLPEKNCLIVCSKSSPFDSIKLIDADSFKEIRGFNLNSDSISPWKWLESPNIPRSVAIPSVGSEFAVTVPSGEIVFFDADDSNPTYRIVTFSQRDGDEVRKDDFSVIAVDSNARYLIGKKKYGDEFILWNWKSKEEIRRWKTSEIVERDQRFFAADSENTESRSVLDESNVTLEPTEISNQDDFEFDDNDDSSSLVDDFVTLGLCFIDDDKILEIMDNAQLKLWDVSTGKLIHSNQVGINKQNCTCYSLTYDGKKVALGLKDGSVLIVSTEDLTSLGILQPTYAELSNLASKVEDVKGEPKYAYIDDYPSKSFLPNSLTGLSWARGGDLLCATYSNGCAVIFDIQKDIPITSFMVNREECVNFDLNPLYVNSVFIKKNHLITLDSGGLIQRWDFSTSKEKTSLLWNWSLSRVYGGNGQRQEWAGILHYKTVGNNKGNFFKIFSGTRLKYTAEEEIEDFQHWNAPNGTSGYLTINKSDGKLSFIDGDSCKVVPNEIDEYQNFPENGLDRICVSNDGTKIAGIERQSFKSWLLDLSKPDSKWELIPWNDDVCSFQLSFSPNSQILASVEFNVLRFWDIKTHREVQRGNGELFMGMVTSYASNRKHKTIADFGKIQFISENLVVQTGMAGRVCIWDVKERSLIQEVEVPLLTTNLPVIEVCEGLNKGRWKNKPMMFVIAGHDGVLRFYQFSEETNQFEPTYVLSLLQLNVFGGEEKVESKQDEKIINEGVTDESHMIIRDITLSDDGEILYVASTGGVLSYNMEEIWKNIDELPQKWQNIDVDSLTKLHFNSSGELTPFVPNRMIRVDK